MIKKLFILCMFTLAFQQSFSQTSAKSIFFELGTPGIASINYDMRFDKKDDGLGFRVGFGGASIDGDGAIFIPIGVNYLIGKDKKNYFELGAGVTVLAVSYNDYDFNTNRNVKVRETDDSFGHLYFGYRYQPKSSGFLFRAGMAPIFNKNFFIPYIPSVSFGYKF